MNSAAAAASAARAHLVIACIGPAVADVVGDGAGEDHRVLRDQRDVLAQIGRIEIGDIDAVEQDAAILRREDSAAAIGTTVDFPAPDGPTSATASPGSIFSEKPFERRMIRARGIVECHIFERRWRLWQVAASVCGLAGVFTSRLGCSNSIRRSTGTCRALQIAPGFAQRAEAAGNDAPHRE